MGIEQRVENLNIQQNQKENEKEEQEEGENYDDEYDNDFEMNLSEQDNILQKENNITDDIITSSSADAQNEEGLAAFTEDEKLKFEKGNLEEEQNAFTSHNPFNINNKEQNLEFN